MLKIHRPTSFPVLPSRRAGGIAFPITKRQEALGTRLFIDVNKEIKTKKKVKVLIAFDDKSIKACLILLRSTNLQSWALLFSLINTLTSLRSNTVYLRKGQR